MAIASQWLLNDGENKLKVTDAECLKTFIYRVRGLNNKLIRVDSTSSPTDLLVTQLVTPNTLFNTIFMIEFGTYVIISVADFFFCISMKCRIILAVVVL